MPPKVKLPPPEDIHNVFISGEEAVTELFIVVIDIVRLLSYPYFSTQRRDS